MKVVVLSAKHGPPLKAVKLLQKELESSFEVITFLENIHTPKKVFSFILKRLKKRGLIDLFDFLLLKLWEKFGSKEEQANGTNVSSLQDSIVLTALKDHDVKHVILAGCSILPAEILSMIKAPIINIHPGITPRYRGGGGNVWAFYEKQFNLVGVTVHSIDAGIDTGKRIAVELFNPSVLSTDFHSLYEYSFERGAKLVLQYLNGLPIPKIDKLLEDLPSRIYTFPGLTVHLKAKRNLSTYLAHSKG